MNSKEKVKKVEKTKEKKKVSNEPRIIDMKKLIIGVILTLIGFYLMTSFYKLTVFMIYRNKINKIPDYKEYIICDEWTLQNKEDDETKNVYDYDMYADGIQYLGHYDVETDCPPTVTFINKDTEEVYFLRYDENIKTYVLDDDWKNAVDPVESVYDQMSIKQMAKDCMPDKTIDLIKMAFNPMVWAGFKGDDFYIFQKEKDVEGKVCFDKKTGILTKMMAKSEAGIVKIGYYYETDKSMVYEKESLANCFDLEDYNCILNSQLIESED